MKYCRFLFENQALYGVVESRAGELWIVDLADAPEEDLAYKLAHAKAAAWSFDFEPMPLSAAGDALEDCLRGTQLSRPREGTGQRGSGGAAVVFQAAIVPAGAGRRGAHAARRGTRGF
jgi:hypothetical protein